LFTASQIWLLANVSLCHHWVYSSSRSVPKALGETKSIKKGLKAIHSLIKEMAPCVGGRWRNMDGAYLCNKKKNLS